MAKSANDDYRLQLRRCSPDLEFSRLESWSRDLSRPVFTSLGLGLGLEPRSLGSGLGLGTSVLVLVLVLEPSSLGLDFGLDLGTVETRSSSLMKREIETK